MIPEKDILEIYKKNFPSRLDNVFDVDVVDEFVSTIYNSYSAEDVLAIKDDSLFVEKTIIKHFLSVKKEEISPEYLSLYARKMNSTTVKAGKPIIIFDELLQHTLISFYLMMFSLIYNDSKENFEKCFKNCIVLLDLQGNKRNIGVHNLNEIVEMCKLPKSTIDLAMDAYWVSWTFIFAHEFYHAKCKDESSQQEELNADKYAYITLIDMIKEQKTTNFSGEIEVFHEYLYLAPMMLLEYFKMLDFYNFLLEKETSYINHPSPELRQKKLFDMFDNYIPEEFDTTQGNAIYNNFLDKIDMLREQLEIKMQKGKLKI